jgi:hypothetical protein
VHEPAAIPVSEPVDGLMVAMVVSELVQTPPVVALVSVTELPKHTVLPPPIVAGEGDGVITCAVDVSERPDAVQVTTA